MNGYEPSHLKREVTMEGDVKAFLDEFTASVPHVKSEVPAAIDGFMGLFNKVMADGALSVREKELVALGIAVAQRCTPCINLHVQKCLKAGADRKQILEAASVAVVMQGGPAFTHLPPVLEAVDELGG
jgi:AhpD family alkylhydroperoxidase